MRSAKFCLREIPRHIEQHTFITKEERVDMQRVITRIRLICLVVLLVSWLPNAVGGQDDKPTIVEKAKTISSISGTTWAGKGFKGRFITFHFKEYGILHYKTPEAEYTNGTWKQYDNAVFAETNKHYTDLLGIISGNTMKGTGWNQHGDEWEWEYSKQDK